MEANPGRVNRDAIGWTPLVAAAKKEERLSLAMWLLDEKGADVCATTAVGNRALHFAYFLDILNAFLERGADPSQANTYGVLPLMWHARYHSTDVVARLLQDQRVRATVNLQNRAGLTALHIYICCPRKLKKEQPSTRVPFSKLVPTLPSLMIADKRS